MEALVIVFSSVARFGVYVGRVGSIEQRVDDLRHKISFSMKGTSTYIGDRHLEIVGRRRAVLALAR